MKWLDWLAGAVLDAIVFPRAFERWIWPSKKEKPRLLQMGGQWFCSYGTQVWGYGVLGKGTIGRGQTAVEAYWNWLDLGGDS